MSSISHYSRLASLALAILPSVQRVFSEQEIIPAEVPDKSQSLINDKILSIEQKQKLLNCLKNFSVSNNNLQQKIVKAINDRQGYEELIQQRNKELVSALEAAYKIAGIRFEPVIRLDEQQFVKLVQPLCKATDNTEDMVLYPCTFQIGRDLVFYSLPVLKIEKGFQPVAAGDLNIYGIINCPGQVRIPFFSQTEDAFIPNFANGSVSFSTSLPQDYVYNISKGYLLNKAGIKQLAENSDKWFSLSPEKLEFAVAVKVASLVLASQSEGLPQQIERDKEHFDKLQICHLIGTYNYLRASKAAGLECLLRSVPGKSLKSNTDRLSKLSDSVVCDAIREFVKDNNDKHSSLGELLLDIKHKNKHSDLTYQQLIDALNEEIKLKGEVATFCNLMDLSQSKHLRAKVLQSFYIKLTDKIFEQIDLLRK